MQLPYDHDHDAPPPKKSYMFSAPFNQILKIDHFTRANVQVHQSSIPGGGG